MTEIGYKIRCILFRIRYWRVFRLLIDIKEDIRFGKWWKALLNKLGYYPPEIRGTYYRNDAKQIPRWLFDLFSIQGYIWKIKGND